MKKGKKHHVKMTDILLLFDQNILTLRTKKKQQDNLHCDTKRNNYVLFLCIK